MSSLDLHTLTQNRDTHSDPVSSSKSPAKSRSYAWLLPVALLLGFISILALLFGEKFLPSIEVTTARAITLRSNQAAKPKQLSTSNTPTKSEMIFQASGWVEPDPYTIFVPALTDGIVKEVHVLEGADVKKGQLLAELIDEDATLIHAAAKQKWMSMKKSIVAHSIGFDLINTEIAGLNRKIQTAEIRIQQGKDTTDRYNKLEKGIISEQQRVLAELNLQELISQAEELRTEIPTLEAKKLQLQAERESMESQLNELETQLNTTKLELERTKIHSPIDGIVLRLHAAPGVKRVRMMDDPNSAVIVELYNPKKLQARIDVPLNEAASMRLQQIVELKSDLLPDRTFTGRVTRITGQADLQRNTLQAKVEIDNPDPRLRPDMLVRAKFFATGVTTDALNTTQSNNTQDPGRLSIFIPQIAVFDDAFVWVVSPENKAERRKISIGLEAKPEHFQILDGVKSGEQVILPPFDKINEGSHLRIIK